MKMLLKLSMILSLCVLLIFGSPRFANGAYPPSAYPCVYINNEKFDIYTAVGYAGVTLVPSRPIFEKYNMTVSWNSKTKTVTATKEGTTIVLTHNSFDAYVNDNKIKLLQPPVYNNRGVFYVPLRFISEAINYEVNWEKNPDDHAAIFISFPDQK